MLIFFEIIHLQIFLAILAVILIGLWIRGRTLLHLFLCAVFGIYLIGVASVVIFPIHIPESGIAFRRDLHLNLIPFRFGNCDFLFLCLRNIYQNILLTIPFGFGISFIIKFKSRIVFLLAIVVGLVFEITQLLISLAVRSSFRVVDVNDVILNAMGVLLGYSLFRIFRWLFILAIKKLRVNRTHFLFYIYDVVR